MMDVNVLVKAHSGIAILVIFTFLIRGGLMIAGSAKLRSVVLTSISHTFLLVLILLGLYIAHLRDIPFSNGFVITKLICLGLFVLFSIFAFKQGLSKVSATIIWLLALATLVYAYLFGNHLVPAFF